ncbi:MAG: hypothetical protein WC475_04125 [Candidatus Paceibacterota bacterium]
MKTNLMVALVITLAVTSIMVAGCGKQSSGAQSFSDLFGKGNGKCTMTNGTAEISWWIDGKDYKLVAKDGSAEDTATVVQKGDFVYIMSSQTNSCISYNMAELNALANQTEDSAQSADAIVSAFKGYDFACTPGVVVEADIAPLENCADMTETLKAAYLNQSA